MYFDILLTVHLSTFLSLFNQLDAQNLFHNKFYFMPLHVLSTYAHHQEVKIALHSLWYHHTYRWRSHACVERGFVITQRDMQLNNTYRIHCCLSTATVVRRTR